MKLKLKTESMVAALKRVTPALTVRTTLPILSNVLLKEEGGELTLTAGDLDKFIVTTVKNAEISQSGVGVTLPGKRMLAVMDANSGDVLIDLDERKSVAKCKTASGLYTLHGVQASEYPPIPSVDGSSVTVEINAEELAEGFRRLYPFISTDETRYVLNGIYIEQDEDLLVMVATDGRRLGRYIVKTRVTGLEPVIIPRESVAAILRLLPANGTVTLKLPTDGGGIFGYEDGTNTLVSKIIEGRYPNYRQVIPPVSGGVKGRIECKTFTATLRRVRLMQNASNNAVKFAFVGRECTLSAETPDVGSSIETVALADGNGDLTICFNGDFFAAALESCGDEADTILTDASSPLRLDSGQFTAVLMPMRLD